MTLGELYLYARTLFGTPALERGLVLTAMLGRYAHAEEREGALLLSVARAGALSARSEVILGIGRETHDILQALGAGSLAEQITTVMASGNISAGRILLCDCYAGGSPTYLLRRLLTWLPPDAVATLKCGNLTPKDISGLFSPRHLELNYL